MAAASVPDDELHDLSPEDADELRAFLEKRRWFESKLKILEELPPIYPFIHPSLNTVQSTRDPQSSSSGPQYKHPVDSKWTIPTVEQLRSWQDERNSLEEEIFVFDGGDLGRMKEKTRAATLIPLTPPSTHLVSITLELIVLIDRLLTLLRHRGELLELTSLRLQWDAMRWQIMQETAKVRSEIHDVARRKARWNPLAIRHDSRTFHRERSSTAASQASLDAATNGRMSRSSTIASVASVASGVSDLSDASILSRDPMGLPSPPRRGSFASMSSMSYRDLASPTKRSSQLPLLHSHIVNLEIRSRTLVSTSVSRSGKLLDKMIDVAIPLKNLGGIEGPIEEAKDTRGAVPDELLDIQDELEGQAGDLANRVTWCKLLEDQWKRADEYHLSSIKAKDAAEAFLEDLQLIFSRPATSQQHTYLSQLLETAQSYLPEPLNQSFPRPEHADYPERQDHTARMEETLHQSRDEASELIQNCQDGLEWYGRILASSERLQGYGGDLKGKRDVLENALRVLARGTETSPRPSLAYPLSLVVETDEWLFVIDKTIRTVQISIDETSEANQRATLTVLKYRQASKSPHGSLRDDPTFEPTEQVADEVNSLTDDVTELLKRASAAINEARQDTDAVPKARAIILSSQEIIRSAESLESKLQWHKEVQGVKTIAKALEDLLIQHRQSVKRPIEDFAGLLRMQNRRVPTLTGYLADMSGSVKAHLADIQGMVTLQWRMAEQERSVEQIEKEAIRYIVKFAELGEQIGPIRKTPVESDLYEKFEGLSSEIESWQQNLVTRMIVLANGAQTPSAATATPSASMQASPLADATPRQTLLPSNTSAARPPMTPPASPPLTPRATDQPRLESSTQRSGSNRLSHARALELDNLTRSRINTASSRVASALDDVRVNITKVQKTRKETVTQKPPTIRSSSYSTRAVSPTVDVFGPLTNLSEPSITATASDQDNTLETLQKRLDDLHLDLILYPPTPLIQATPSLRHLPTPTSANTIKDGLASISLGVDKLLETSPHIEPISNLQMTLAASQAEIPRLDQLAEFTTAIRVCDETFSRLLYDLDENAMDRALLVSMRNSAGQAVKRSEEFASDLESDRRVTAEMKRVRRAWKDLDALVNETLNPDRLAEEDEINVDDPISDISSIAESVVSAVASTRRPVSAASNRRISSSSSSSLLPVPVRIRGLPATPGARPDRNRAASNPANATAFPPLSVTRDRAVSDTPSRSRAENLKGKGVPTFRRPSLDPITPQHVGSPAVRPGSNMSLHPRYSTNPASVVSSSIQTPSGTPDQTPRPRLSVGRSSRPRPPPRKAYIADPKNKLDVAVGKIVNKLNVDIPIRPVSLNGSEEWKDLSGRYWIGAEGRAKLCFCRILRSRTVMVRVGGGWVELSKFLLDHFADSLGTWQPPPGGVGIGSSTPIPITSASLFVTPAKTPAISRSASHSQLRQITTAGAPILTPVRHALPAPVSDKDLLTRPRDPNISANLSTTSPNGGSPLFPLHFIRKASESPPMREKEKEQLKAGRRSILGRVKGAMGTGEK